MSKKAKSVSRIYAVTRKGHGTLRLVKAGNWAQALRHVAKDEYTVDVAEQDQLVEAVNRGVKVELATETTTLTVTVDTTKVREIVDAHRHPAPSDEQSSTTQLGIGAPNH